MLTLKGKENVTKSGQKINLYANIGNVSDLAAVLKMMPVESDFSVVNFFILKRYLPNRRRTVCSL